MNETENTEPQRAFCSNCQREVIVSGKGQCSICHRFLKGNYVAGRHPVNVARLDVLDAQLSDEFKPQTVSERHHVRNLAAVYEQLEGIRPGTMEHQRLSEQSRLIIEDLRESMRSRVHSATLLPALHLLPDRALLMLLDYSKRIAAGDILTDFEEGQYQLLKQGADGVVLLPGYNSMEANGRPATPDDAPFEKPREAPPPERPINHDRRGWPPGAVEREVHTRDGWHVEYRKDDE